MLPVSFLMAEVCKICINYLDLQELSLLGLALVRSVIAKSLSASMAGPKASHNGHQFFIR